MKCPAESIVQILKDGKASQEAQDFFNAMTEEEFRSWEHSGRYHAIVEGRGRKLTEPEMTWWECEFDVSMRIAVAKTSQSKVPTRGELAFDEDGMEFARTLKFAVWVFEKVRDAVERGIVPPKWEFWWAARWVAWIATGHSICGEPTEQEKDEIERFIRNHIEDIRTLTNDCLAKLPPLVFPRFSDSVPLDAG